MRRAIRQGDGLRPAARRRAVIGILLSLVPRQTEAPVQLWTYCFGREIMERRATLLGALALPLLTSCRSVDTEQTTTLNAVVETVDPVSRELLLRGSGGAQSGAPPRMVGRLGGRGLHPVR